MTKNTKFSIEIDETELIEIENIYNGNTQVCVTLPDGFCLTATVGTPENLKYLMAENKVNFFAPGLPWIIVQKLTKEVIYEAVQGYMDDRPDGFWLKMCYFASDFDSSVFDNVQAEDIKITKKYQDMKLNETSKIDTIIETNWVIFILISVFIMVNFVIYILG